MVCSCYKKHIVIFFNKEGVELFQIEQDQIGSNTYDTLYIKEENSLAVSSGTGECMLSTDIGGRSATIIWACLSFFLTKVNSQGVDSTTTSPKF
jgi:hypothetical protein